MEYVRLSVSKRAAQYLRYLSHLPATFLLLIIALSITGCATLQQPPVKEIYAPYAKMERNPVIVIPGIKGSELKNIEKNRNVWGGWWQFSKSDFDDLELKIGPDGASDSYEIFNVDSNVQATNIFSRWSLLGFLREASEIDIYQSLIDTLVDYGGYTNASVEIKYDAYGNLVDLEDLRKDGETNPKENLFVFYYDWRRDNVLNAVNLARFVEKLKEKYYPQKDVKFNIVAHSMGGLVTRFYLGYHSFCAQAAQGKANIYDSVGGLAPDNDPPKNIGKVVLLGTPGGGSLEILRAFLSGEGVETLSKKDVKRIIITMPAAYQLFPPSCTQDCLTPLDEATKATLGRLDNTAACDPELYKYSLVNPSTWKELQWSVFDPDWDISGRDEKQRMVTKSLNRAQEFFGALRKTESNSSLNNILKLMGGDCAVTLRKGMIQGKEVLLSEGGMEEKIRAMENRETDKKMPAKSYDVPEKLRSCFAPGDGTVTRTSMLHGVVNANTLFVCQKHGTLFKDVTLQDNLLYELLLKDNPAYTNGK